MPSARQRRKKRRAQEREAAAAMTEPPSLTCSHASALAPADSLANPTLSPCPLSTPIEIARRQKRNHEDDVDKEPVQQKLKTNKLDAADNRLIEDAKKKSTADTLAAYKKWEEQIRHHTGSVILKKIRQRFPPDGEEREIWERRIRQEDEEHLMFVYKAFIRKYWNNDYMWKYASVLHSRVTSGLLVKGEYLGAISFPEQFMIEVSAHISQLQTFIKAAYGLQDGNKATKEMSLGLREPGQEALLRIDTQSPSQNSASVRSETVTPPKQIISISDGNIKEDVKTQATFKLERTIKVEDGNKTEESITLEQEIKAEENIKIETRVKIEGG